MTGKASSVLSAVVWRPDRNGGKVLVKESTHGWSLLGSDRIDWGKGIVEGLVDRICEQHDLLIQPYAINGIYSGVSPSGRFIGLNINFRADVCIESKDKGLQWIGREQILSGNEPVNTPDLLEALKDLDNPPKACLDFVASSGINRFVSQSSEQKTGEIVASSTVIYNPLTGKVCFVVRGDGYYSNIGGKVENPALLEEYLREHVEEVGTNLSGNLRGFVGVFTKRTPSGRFVTSMPAFAVVHNEDLHPSPNVLQSGELSGVEWFSMNELRNIPIEKFYTPDSLASAVLGVEKYRRGKSLAPLSIVRSVKRSAS